MTEAGKTISSGNAALLASIFLPLYAIYCMEQVYFVYGNVLRDYGFPPQDIGWLLGSYFVTIMLSRPVASWMLENLGTSRTMAVASAAGFIGCSMLLVFRGLYPLLAGRILSGVSFGVFTTGIFSYQASAVTEKMRGASFAITVSGGMLPMATVTPLGEWLLINSHERIYLTIGPAACVICYFLGKRLGARKIASGEQPEAWGGYRDLISFRPYLALVITATIVSLVDAATVSMSLLASERQLVASYFLASSSVAAVIFRLCCAGVLNRLPRSACLAPCGILMGCSLLAIAMAPSNTSFLIFGAAFGIGIGAAFPIFLAATSDVLPPSLRPKGTACALFLYDFGWFVTPLLVGYATPVFGIAWTFRFLALAALLALGSLTALYWAPSYLKGRRVGA
ncbi:MAG: MFS transporter [Synergistaceae bacterium]|jgi:MFS family permease|nr:MFS transporter [Synergistaceae bacterium]